MNSYDKVKKLSKFFIEPYSMISEADKRFLTAAVNALSTPDGYVLILAMDALANSVTYLLPKPASLAAHTTKNGRDTSDFLAYGSSMLLGDGGEVNNLPTEALMKVLQTDAWKALVQAAREKQDYKTAGVTQESPVVPIVPTVRDTQLMHPVVEADTNGKVATTATAELRPVVAKQEGREQYYLWFFSQDRFTRLVAIRERCKFPNLSLDDKEELISQFATLLEEKDLNPSPETQVQQVFQSTVAGEIRRILARLKMTKVKLGWKSPDDIPEMRVVIACSNEGGSTLNINQAEAQKGATMELIHLKELVFDIFKWWRVNGTDESLVVVG